MRSLSIGALLIDDWRREAFFTGLHAAYLQRKFPAVEIGVSVPRVRPNLGGFLPPVEVTDRDLVQIILALRLFLPRAGISVSTREKPRLRDHLIKLGVTRISAASVTAVGGHAAGGSGGEQFLQDGRTVEEIKEMEPRLSPVQRLAPLMVGRARSMNKLEEPQKLWGEPAGLSARSGWLAPEVGSNCAVHLSAPALDTCGWLMMTGLRSVISTASFTFGPRWAGRKYTPCARIFCGLTPI